ncbi:MAG TPA: zinc ribbon domain-containing protein, partial [Thermoplasmata archaeon]|nr:zinc ribbon domain-containing protein [Thermoplasmata archaeon]
MSLSLAAPTRAGSVGGRARGSISALFAVIVVVLMVVSGVSFLFTVPHPAASGTTPSAASPAAVPPYTHGDLNVTKGETFVIQPTPGSRTYYQGGNITVFSGGTLIVRNVTLSFVQFVSDIGTPLQRLSHIYRFDDLAGGTIHFYNSTLTTDVQIINAWAKLNFTVLGDVTTWNTTFAFPGWLNVEGSAASFTFNDSSMTENPAVASLLEPGTIRGDTSFAASVSVTGGAQMNVLNSSLNNTYADNTANNGHPQPVPLTTDSYPHEIAAVPGDNNFSSLDTPTDSANLTQDWLYPNADFLAGNLEGNWTNSNKTIEADVTAYVWYDDVQYQVGAPMIWANQSAGGFNLPLPSALLVNITTLGVLNYLNWTGDFGAGPSLIAIEFDITSGPPAVEVASEISILPSPQYNMVVSGASTTLNSVDSEFGLTWNALPANSTSQTIPLPWLSNKLLVANHAQAYLANMTVEDGLPGVFSHSAVLPDSTSVAYFYRWAQFNLTGRGGQLPIPAAHVSAYYAYTTNQSNNQTTNALNDLAVANPQIWGYVLFWDHAHGVTYGESNVQGKALLLLASSNLTAATLPDGYFLGGYHIGVAVSAPGVGDHWFNWSVSPYPEGVAQTPPKVASPDYAPSQNFPGYFGGVAITSLAVLANGVASTNVNLGQTVSVVVGIEDSGTAPIIEFDASLYYQGQPLPGLLLAYYENTTLNLTTPGQPFGFTLSWVATGDIVGNPTAALAHNLTLVMDWNHNQAPLAGGNTSQVLPLEFQPTLVTVSSVVVLANGVAVTNSTVLIGQTLGVQVTLTDVGNSTIQAVSAALYYNATKILGWFNDTAVTMTTAGATFTVPFSWKVLETVVGVHGWDDLLNMSVRLTWNNNTADRWLGYSGLSHNVTVTFDPSQIRFVTFTSGAPTTIDLSNFYEASGQLEFNATPTHAASILLWATPVNGGSPVEIAAGASPAGFFNVTWFNLQDLSPGLVPGTSYVLKAEATYNSRSTNLTLPGTYLVPSPPTSSSNFLTQKILGLPLWVWLAIAAAIVVGIVAFLFIARRQAVGKLVECGECGNLIPEDATTCPKCGAEFETDLLRCSRCASTIPANSKFCPECAAQLLGAPGEAKADPEKQAYADFTEKYRAEAKRELGDNYSEGAFWDWWKRQP